MAVDNNLLENYDVQKVNRFNVILIWIFSTVLTVQAFAIISFSHGQKVAVATYSAAIVSTIFYLLNRSKIVNLSIAAIIICMTPVIKALWLIYLEKGDTSAKSFMVILLCACMVALYFRKGIVLAFGGVLLVVLGIAYALMPQYILGAHPSNTELSGRLGVILCGTSVLYFLTKWGNDYVTVALKKEKDARELIEKLSDTMKNIDHGSKVLNENIEKLDEAMNNIKDKMTRTIELSLDNHCSRFSYVIVNSLKSLRIYKS